VKQHRHIFKIIFFTFLLIYLLSPVAAHAQSADPVVRAILFYSPTCPHCAMVIQEDLPPLFEKYNTQLTIFAIDVSQAEGAKLYQTATTSFQIPENRLGVPTLIVGNTVLVGSLEISEQFPGLVEYYLSVGGVDWPELPGFEDVLANSATAPTPDHQAPPTADSSAPQSPTLGPVSSSQDPSPPEEISPDPAAPGLTRADGHDLSWQQKFTRDLGGNTLSVIVLLGMLASLVWGYVFFVRRESTPQGDNVPWLVPALSLVGIVVAGYLAYVETARVSAVCGPVGDCNTVQQSEYARLFGVLPIGVLGLSGYGLIVLAWLGARFGREGIQSMGALALLGMTLAGTLFSIYLTFLEPFVIGATCAWCLTSAIVMTILMLLSLGPGKKAYWGFSKLSRRKSR